MTDPSRQAGFTLIETLVALAILAVIASLVFPVFLDVARRSSRAETTRIALLLAESKLAEAGALAPLAHGETAGETEAFRWAVRIAPYGERPGNPDPGVALYEVFSTVTWVESGKPQSVALQTLRLGGGR